MDEITFKFDLVDQYTPDTVIKGKLKQVETATRGYVKACIKAYNGPIASYTKTYASIAESLNSAFQRQEKEVDIQQDLGEQNRKDYRYEVFLSVKGLEHYKYRMMFVDYGTISYPVTIVMNEELAVEYSGRRNTTFSIESVQKLEEMMDRILRCKTMLSLIQNLINEAIRRENKSSDHIDN